MYENMRIMELTKSVQQHRKMEYIAAQKTGKMSKQWISQHSSARPRRVNFPSEQVDLQTTQVEF